MLIARATEKELILYIKCLKTENRILRSKLPKRINVTPAERAKLVKLGVRLGSAVKELISIVHPHTFARWISEGKSKSKPRQRERPRKPEEIRQLIIEMAKATGWGTKRILGELRKLRIRNISRSTIARILQENGFDPGPKRGDGTWHEFIQRHIKPYGLPTSSPRPCGRYAGQSRITFSFYILFFIHVHTRRVHIAGSRNDPNGPALPPLAQQLA